MDTKSFDQIIKNKLEEHTVPNNLDHFASFQSRLDHEFGLDTTTAEDASFDAQLKEKLAQNQAPIPSGAWSTLESKIEEDKSLRREVLKVKAFECFILLLVLFTVWNLDIVEKTTNFTKKVLHKDQIAEVIDQIQQVAPLKLSNIHINKVNKIPKTPRVSVTNDLLKALPVLNQTTNRHAADLSSPTTNVSQKSLLQGSLLSHNKENDPILHEHLLPINQSDNQSFESKPIKSSIWLLPNIIQSQIFTQTPKPSTTQSRTRMIIASIDALSLPLTTSNLEYKDLEVYADIKPIQQNTTKSSKKWLNISGSADLNLINSPFDFVYLTPAYYTDAIGSTGGIGLSWDNELTEISTGLNYSTKSYTPRINTETTGDFNTGYQKTSLSNIFFNVVSIPINLKIHTSRTRNWSYYVSIGAAANFVINSNYVIEEELLSSPGITEENEILTNVPRLNQKTFDEGFLEGGDFNDNTYLTTNLGIGIQRKICNEVSLYLQPSYSYHMLNKGIGPNKDRLHAVSLEVGAKIALF